MGYKQRIRILGIVMGIWGLAFRMSYGQKTQKVNPQFAIGDLINEVRIVIHEDSLQTEATQKELEDFYNAFFISPGTTFNPMFADIAMRRIEKETNVQNAYYELYQAQTGSGNFSVPVNLVIYVKLVSPEEESGEKGILATNEFSDFPYIYESDRSQFKFHIGGGLGFYNDINSLFGRGAEFTQGNPVADNPAGEETRFWAETYVEPGISGISKLFDSNLYWYGEISGLASFRNTNDLYSSGSTGYLDFERLYAGILAANLGSNKNITVNASYGRNFYQLNDGFLISKISGSANAGDRGSVYSSSRKTFQKNGNLSVQWGKMRLSGHFLEPEEVFKDRQVNTNYIVSTLNYNNNRNLDVGFSYIATTGGKARYITPEGPIQKKGMYVLNPKIWLSNIAGTNIFFKTEYAFQSHTKENMRSHAWYAGLGYRFNRQRTSPSLYYRYAFMQGDNISTDRYERFDPILSGGLGDWVQGLNFRKVVGKGNIISHRLQFTTWVSQRLSLSFNYFYLRADELTNLGGLAPISQLKSKELGHEITLTLKGLLFNHVAVLGVLSHSIPGKGIRDAFEGNVPNWTTAQLAVFINI